MNSVVARYKIVNLCIRYYQTVKPHVPSIKFKKGIVVHKNEEGSHENEPIYTSCAGSVPPNVSKTQQTTRIVLESYQLPQRYRRLPLDDTEIEIINVIF